MAENKIIKMLPRVLFAGVSSGCGKTTVACAVLQAFVNRGLRVHSFKCGPDYIDPMFHERIIGTKGSNLDLFFYGENTVRRLMAKDADTTDIAVIEGVMGYYDGVGIKTMEKSSYEVAKAVSAPAVLVINCKGMAFSVTAVLRGFLSTVKESGIRGVILNNITKSTYGLLKEAIEEQFGGQLKVLGYMPNMKDCMFESRHLGLITVAEIEDIKAKLNKLADQAEQSVDLDGILALAKETVPVEYEEEGMRGHSVNVSPRIAVAMDKAFCFYYRDNLDILRELGAKLVFFSPMEDEALPDCDGLYLGGGYPELHLEALAGNEGMRASIKTALAGGLPCIAECGGFMYLTEGIEGRPMVGFLPGACENQGRLIRFGYVTLTAQKDNMLCKAGEAIRAHEFHHYDAEFTGKDFTAVKSSGKSWDCVFANDTLYAGYPHLPFYSNPEFAKNFYQACCHYKKNR